MIGLDSLVFRDQLDKNTLQNLLEILDHVKVEYISREDYRKKEKSILEKTQEEDELGYFYVLYLPNDLEILEQVSIIYLLMDTFRLNPILSETLILLDK